MIGAAPAPERPRPATVPPGRGEVILVVDDDPLVLSLTQRVLDRLGYTVLAARDGQQAIELVEHAPGPVDLLLTDVIMPNQSGPALHECILRLRPGVKVIYMSGYPGDQLAESVDAPLLPKPFTLQKLGQTVRTVLDDSRVAK
jgi:CheY-like chemotaxis protein